ncbi:DotI/IcmL family type IV secretion protein (plasmid) [Methylocaldum sp. MU1018]|jgi:intracellular multiplication protein IcmL|uniref:DotI/IcmL family type IV secretion protein n=1 Tax=Betaproteobacteria TaxID=28216 RepID=UPI000C781BFB|nr:MULTISPECIES: DotI/IcmL family type IV secretion protein [Betaproteobacteria]EIP5862314.1 DotI/IcmL family type IV secretion protein [Salmonella enterica]MCB3688418.1 DotI/IcmL family type IV secretion protein [Klebsiella pneumoniae]EIQ2412555.1 DotI/IcmL family type IV secretion protein [Salmonella enterica]MPS90264.1 type IV secretion protein DotI [Comamonas sp.]HBZ8879201.1 DotI/IcmL family type IV secretion protein [Klebsiella pneumoniae]
MSNKEAQGKPSAKQPSASPSAELDEAKLDQLANDMSPGEGAAVLREVARLQQENKALKGRNLRVWTAVGVLSATFFVTVSAGIAWYPKYRYIPTTDNRAICEVSTESDPRVTPATLADYAKDAVVNAYSYDYVNYREALNATAAKWFTDDGRKAFLRSLDESGNLERVLKGRLILRAMATKVPQLEEEGRRGLQRYWVVQVPVAIEFYSGGDQQPRTRQDFLAGVTIVQTPASATNLKGIAVDSISLAPYVARK